MELSNTMFNQLFESAPIGLALNNMDGSFIEFNQELLDITGYTKDEFSKLSYWDLTPIEYKKQEKEQLEFLKKTKSYGPYEKEYYHKKGYRVNVLLNGMIVTDNDGTEYIWSIVQDISQSKKSEKVLNKAQELGNIGHWHLDLLENKLEWSDETYRIFGLIPQEFSATYEAFVERIYPDDRDLVNAAYTNSLEVDEPYQIEHRVIHTNGNIRYVVERCEHYHSKDGEIIGSIGSVLDITDRKLTENALLEAKNRAESANVAKSSFIANMNHELRTPLNAILGFSKKILNDSELKKEHKKDLETICNSGEHLLHLISDILDMSKIEVGEMKIVEAPFDLYNTFNEISGLMSNEAKSKNLNCISNISDDVPRYILSDNSKIKQVLINLIGNAIKFTDSGSIKMDVSVNYIDNKSMLNIDVSDTGCGIQKSMINDVFKPFVQNDGLKKVEGGTGLGLSISQKILALLGGSISLKSKVGEGSTFSVSFPIRESEETLVLSQANEESDELKMSIHAQEKIVIDSYIKELPVDIVKAILVAATIGSRLQLKKELEKIQYTHELVYKHFSSLIDNYNFEEIIRLIKDNNE